MPKITVAEVKIIAVRALRGQGIPEVSATAIAEEMALAEYMEIKTHGLGKLISLNIGDLTVKPTFSGAGPIFHVDGNKGNGFLTFSAVANELIKRTAQHGVAVATVSNTTRYSSLFPYPAKVARSGYVSILMNSAGPAAVAPFGSIDPITGTNPICFSFPKDGGVHSFDMATSEIVWGEIRQAALEARRLPSGPFLTAAGDVTSDPTNVNAVKVFGGAKGSALNLAIEILAGILSRGNVGLQCRDEFDCGALFIAIDPSSLGISTDDFARKVDTLFDDIRNARPESASRPVRVPGDRGRSSITIESVLQREIEVPQAIIDMLARMAEGESVSELASNPLFN